MKFGSGAFDVVLDKGTLDCLTVNSLLNIGC